MRWQPGGEPHNGHADLIRKLVDGSTGD